MVKSVNHGGPPPFDLPVATDGYRWWYLDAVSHDGRHALVIIVFIGSVFSPYYYRARARNAGDPMAYCAFNVALYGPGSRWCMTERRARSVARSSDALTVGPSRVSWDGRRMVFDICERGAPFGKPLRGRVVAHAGDPCALDVGLDMAGRHRWTPWSPHGEVDVSLDRPGLAWRGPAYLDANAGSEPLERAFRSWDWSRTEAEEGSKLHYTLQDLRGQERRFCYAVDRTGDYREAPVAPEREARRTGWGLLRTPRTDHPIEGEQSLEDTPFYSRSLFTGPGDGVRTVHEHLDLARFRAGWVRLLLPFRMPREPRARAPRTGRR